MSVSGIGRRLYRTGDASLGRFADMPWGMSLGPTIAESTVKPDPTVGLIRFGNSGPVF